MAERPYVPFASTDPMRKRLRELADPDLDDFDSAVVIVLDDFERLLAWYETARRDSMAEQRESVGASDWQHKLAAFVTEILHGDGKHKEWLWNAAHAFVAGDPVPKPDSASIPDNEELVAVRELVEQQANDEGLWFVAHTAPEAYLQQELRKLHSLCDALARLGRPR